MGKRKPKKAEPTPVGDLLTSAQRAVVNHTTGPLLAGAVAGAGKSTTLIERVAALYQHGTPLNRICLVAFNVSAAEDLNRKLKKRLKNVDTGEEDKEVARTLHSLALQIFKSEEQNRYMKLDTSGSLWSKAIREAHKSLGYGFTDVDTVKAFASKVRNDYIACDPTLARLGHFDADLLAAAEMTLRKKREPMFGSAEDVVRVFLEADRIRYSGEVSSGDGAFIDFDALVWEATRMLERDDGLRTVWQRRFDFILVDEAQDLCEAQWRMVEMLAEQHHNIVVVGDPAQALYRFRGARPERLLDFMNRWPGAHGSYMEHNFRSGSDILVAGNIVLDRMDATQKLPMHLVCTRDEKGFVGVLVEKEPRDEAAAIMRACHAQKAAGREWRDMAILVRLNAQTKDIELQAFKAEVPIRMVSGSSFFTLPETKAMLGYFRVLLGQADEDDLLVAVSNPSRYLGRAFVEQVKRAVPNVDQPSDWLEAIPNSYGWREPRAQQFVQQMREWRSSMKRGATPAQLLERILETTHYAEWHMRERADVDSANNANSFSATLERVREFMADFESVEQMLTTVDKMRAAQRSAAQSRNAVTVSTVHVAKGLEWGVVFVPGLVANVWPTPWGQINDELRCFYVAVTRARDILWLSRYEVGNPLEAKDSEPSTFLQMLLPGANTQTKPEADVQVASGQMTLL